MFDPSGRNSVGRFTGLANLYSAHRPDYPSAAIDFILSHCAIHPAMRLIDVGCGTGIASRQFVQRGLEVIGIEPNPEMRRAADALHGPITYREGRAEETGLPSSYADAVLAAQAFHWFQADKALREFHRIL